jgi:hypothetical protein
VTAEAQGRPIDVDLTFPIENCGFTILVELSGKSKTKVLPGGRATSTSPGLTATLTNLGNGNQETLVITGAFHQRNLENGDVETVATGRNALLDPTVPGLVGALPHRQPRQLGSRHGRQSRAATARPRVAQSDLRLRTLGLRIYRILP